LVEKRKFKFSCLISVDRDPAHYEEGLVLEEEDGEKMNKEQRNMPEWTPSARAYQKAVNMVYDETHSIQDDIDLDEDQV
jgi:hypothetical protein